MKTLLTLTVVVVAASSAIYTWSPSNSQAETNPPQRELLVLTNGQVVAGIVTMAGERFLVRLDNQDEVGVPLDRVEMRCTTLEEAYTRQRDLISPKDLRRHLELGDWCIRQEYFAGAVRQLMFASGLDPDDPRVLRLERRLRVAAQSQKPAPKPTGPQSEAEAPSVPDKKASSPSLTPQQIEQFTSRVQPLLLNRCANGGCHGVPSTNDYQLVRPVVGNTMPRAFTQRNLTATARYVSRENEIIPLLDWARRRHGDQEAFGPRDQASWETLERWVKLIMQGERNRPARIEPSNQLMLQPAGGSWNPNPDLFGPPTDPLPDTAAGDISPATSEAPAAKNSPAVDPFDPAEFNRLSRHSTDRQPSPR